MPRAIAPLRTAASSVAWSRPTPITSDASARLRSASPIDPPIKPTPTIATVPGRLQGTTLSTHDQDERSRPTACASHYFNVECFVMPPSLGLSALIGRGTSTSENDPCSAESRHSRFAARESVPLASFHDAVQDHHDEGEAKGRRASAMAWADFQRSRGCFCSAFEQGAFHSLGCVGPKGAKGTGGCWRMIS